LQINIVGKLLLASSGQNSIHDQALIRLLPRDPRQLKAAFIHFAGSQINTKPHLQGALLRLEVLFGSVCAIDLNQFVNERHISARLRQFDVIYVAGGNTFTLLEHVRRLALKKVLNKLLSKGVVYYGSSAGAYITCPTIEMATWKNASKWNRFGLTDLKALNLV